MIELLGQLARAEDLPIIAGLLGRDASPTIQLAAVGALGSYAEASAAAPLLDRYRSAAPAVRARILGLLCSRRQWAGALMDAIEHHRVAAKDLTPAHVQTVVQLSDPALLARLEAAWGKVPRVGSPEKKQRIAELRGLLPEGDKGNAARGRPIFKENSPSATSSSAKGRRSGPTSPAPSAATSISS